MMKFDFKGKSYKISDTLNSEELHESLLAEETKKYHYRYSTCYIKAGEKEITTQDSVPSYSLKLTAYSLLAFATAILQLDKSGWQIDSAIPTTNYGSYSYSCTLNRNPDAQKSDLEEIAKSLPALIERHIEEFNTAKEQAKKLFEKQLREELQELTSMESRKRSIYRNLKELEA